MKLFIAMFLVIVSTVASAASVQVGGAEIMELPDGSQLALDLSGPVKHESFTLENPPRLVVDLKNARLAPRVKGLKLRSADVRSVRTGIRAGVDLRLVLDLQSLMRSEVQLVPDAAGNGYRLVVDVFRKNGPVPAVVRTSLPPSKPSSLARPRAQVKPAKAVPSLVSPRARVQPTKAAASPPPPKVQSKAVRVAPTARYERSRKELVIAIDPGHGGKDPGAIGPRGTREKRVVMEIARRLQALIRREKGMRAVMTRSSDRYLYLYDRIKIARRHKADLFISLHADAAPNADARGASVYILSSGRASSVAAKLLADQENAADRVGGMRLVKEDDVNSVLIDMHQDATLEASLLLADVMIDALQRVGNVHKRRVERASFAVLTSPVMPSILVETAFISNRNEETLLRSSRYQQKVAEAIMNGIRAYARKRPTRQYVVEGESALPANTSLSRGFRLVSSRASRRGGNR